MPSSGNHKGFPALLEIRLAYTVQNRSTQEIRAHYCILYELFELVPRLEYLA